MGKIEKAHLEAMKALQRAKENPDISEDAVEDIKQAHREFMEKQEKREQGTVSSQFSTTQERTERRYTEANRQPLKKKVNATEFDKPTPKPNKVLKVILTICIFAVGMVAGKFLLSSPDTPATTNEVTPVDAKNTAVFPDIAPTKIETPEEIYAKAKDAYAANDYTKAFNLYKKAAEQEYAEAQNQLGVMYSSGQGVPQDKTEAVKWFRKAAEQGHVKGQSNLRAMYLNGAGVNQDYAEAVKWLCKAAEQGEVLAQSTLGFMYTYGYGVTQDYFEAVKWYRNAAEQGLADAQNSLGVLYANGYGVAKDYAEAAKWYHKAAEQGDARAQYNLGVMYESGEGVSRDYVEAVKWYRKAAEQGNAPAKQRLESFAN